MTGVPGGTKDNEGWTGCSFAPSGLIGSTDSNPPMNRWAILWRPCGTGTISLHHPVVKKCVLSFPCPVAFWASTTRRGRGGIGRRARFRFWFRKEWRFKSSRPYQLLLPIADKSYCHENEIYQKSVSRLCSGYAPIFNSGAIISNARNLQSILATPGAAALVLALWQLLRDEASFAKERLLKQEERIHALGVSSHMAEVAFDKHGH